VSDDAQRQLAQRRLLRFERNIQSVAAAMGETDPATIARLALGLASHAALAAAFDPGLLHLIRINFFFDRQRVPHWVEARVLLSELCRDVEGNGLYEMDAAVRDMLLGRLNANYPPERVRGLATLLWQYAERRATWADRSELRHAQQITALNFLAPERAAVWLEEAEHGEGSAALSKEWFVAMRGSLPPARPPRQVDGAAVCAALQELDFAAQRALHSEQLKKRDVRIFILRGPRDHAHRWALLRLLKDVAPAPALADLSVDPSTKRSMQQLLAMAVDLPPDSPWLDVIEHLARFTRSRPLAIAIDTDWMIGAVGFKGFPDLVKTGLPICMYLMERTTSAEIESVLGPISRIALAAAHAHFLPALAPIALDDLRGWIERHGAEAKLDRGTAPDASSPESIAQEILDVSGGVPDRVFEQLCVRCGVLWPDMLARAAAPFTMPRPADDDPIAVLAREYEARRAALEPGPARTRTMEQVVARMRDLLATRKDWPVETWTESPSPGMRLAATALLQLRPQASLCAWLGGRVQEETPFVAYHALLALLNAATELPPGELDAVSLATQRAMSDLAPADARTDRANLLRQTERVLAERHGGAATYLPLLPLRNAVVLPGCTVETLLDRTESVMGLFKVLNGGDNTVFCTLDLSAGQALNQRKLRKIGAIATVSVIRTVEAGVHVRIDGVQRARGIPTWDPSAGRPVLAQVTPLGVPSDEWDPISARARDVLTAATIGLSRIGGISHSVAQQFRRNSDVADCYRMADALGLPPSDRQALLEKDDLNSMVAQLLGLVIARIAQQLPEDFAADRWGLKRLAELLEASEDNEARIQLLEAHALDPLDRRAMTRLIDRSAANGTLRDVVAAALAYHPRDERLWEHVEAMTARPEHPGSARATRSPAAPAKGAEPLKLWPNGSTLRIKFLGGDKVLHDRVMRFAAQWLEHANLHFEVLPAGSRAAADIRIAFDPQDGSWAYLGTDARNVPATHPTMNLGWANAKTPDPEFRQAVLMQFGHVLGLIQEHQNPNGGIDWDREGVMSSLTGAPNFWTKEQVEYNILKRYKPLVPPYRPFDPHSIMLFAFPAEQLKSRQPISGGTTLSASDKAFIAELYPRNSSATPPARKAPVRKQRQA